MLAKIILDSNCSLAPILISSEDVATAPASAASILHRSKSGNDTAGDDDADSDANAAAAAVAADDDDDDGGGAAAETPPFYYGLSFLHMVSSYNERTITEKLLVAKAEMQRPLLQGRWPDGTEFDSYSLDGSFVRFILISALHFSMVSPLFCLSLSLCL